MTSHYACTIMTNRSNQFTSFPEISNLSYAEISRATGISASMLSRMFSDDPKQKRPNPTLTTLITLRDYLESQTGTKISLDDMAAAIR